jgi:hypothetical protein
MTICPNKAKQGKILARYQKKHTKTGENPKWN